MPVEPETAIPEKYLGELEPQAHLLPPEFYRQPEKREISQLAMIGEFPVTVSQNQEESPGIYQVTVFNPEGKAQDIKLSSIGLNVAQLVKGKFKPHQEGGQINLGYIPSGQVHSGSSLTGFLPATGLNEAQQEILKSFLVTTAQKAGIVGNGEWVRKSALIEQLGNSRLPFSEIKLIPVADRRDLLILSAGGQSTAIQLVNNVIQEADLKTVAAGIDWSKVNQQEGVNNFINGAKAEVSIVQLDNKITTIRDKKGQVLRSFRSESVVLDERKAPTLYIISEDGKKVRKVDLEKVKAGIWRPEDLDIELPANAKLETILLDPYGNFLAVEYQADNTHVVNLIDKESGRVWYSFENTSSVMTFDPSGNIIFIDSEGRLRQIQTNFSHLPVGGIEALAEARQERLTEMAAKIQQLTLTMPQSGAKVETSARAISEEALIRQLTVRVGEIVKKPVEEAQSVAELEALREQLEVIRQQEEFINYPESFAPAEQMILQRENILRVAILEKAAAELQLKVGEIISLEESAALVKELAELKAERTKASIMDPQQRQLIDARLKTLEGLTSEAMKQHLGVLNTRLEATLEAVRANLQTAANEAEIGQIYTDENFIKMQTLLSFVSDPAKRQEWEQALTQAIASKRRALMGTQSRMAGPHEYERASAVQITREIFTELEKQVAQIASGRELERIRQHPLAVQLLQHARRADPGLGREAQTALEKLIEDRRSTIETERELQRLRAGEVIRFNGTEFAIFSPPPPDFEVKTTIIRRSRVGMESRYRSTREYLREVRKRSHKHALRPVAAERKLFQVEFIDKKGRAYKPERPVSEEELDSFLKEESVNARHHFESAPRFVPNPPSDFKLTPFYRELLAKIAQELNIQTEIQEGMLILEGPAGVGKNMSIDILAALSNREVFIVPCHAQMDKEDLTYTIEFDPQRGTIKRQSSLLEALATPGAIVVFNEVNTAPTGVVKMANPLADYMRTMFLSIAGDKRAIRPDPSVLLIGVMNPENYLGTKALAQDFKSRSTILEVDYPPVRDEATILASRIDSLKKLQIEEFEKLWDYVIGGNAASGGDQFRTPEAQQDLPNLNILVKVAAKIREAHQKFMTGENDEVVNFDFTLRESRTAAIRYNLEKRKDAAHRRTIKQIIGDTVLPKIADLEERERIKTIIDHT